MKHTTLRRVFALVLTWMMLLPSFTPSVFMESLDLDEELQIELSGENLDIPSDDLLILDGMDDLSLDLDDLTLSSNDTSPEPLPFEQTVTFEDVTVRVTAAAGVMPDGSSCRISDVIEDESANAAREAVEAALVGKTLKHHLYNIELLDRNGNSVLLSNGVPVVHIAGLDITGELCVFAYNKNGSYETDGWRNNENIEFNLAESAIYDIVDVTGEKTVEQQPVDEQEPEQKPADDQQGVDEQQTVDEQQSEDEQQTVGDTQQVTDDGLTVDDVQIEQDGQTADEQQSVADQQSTDDQQGVDEQQGVDDQQSTDEQQDVDEQQATDDGQAADGQEHTDDGQTADEQQAIDEESDQPTDEESAQPTDEESAQPTDEESAQPSDEESDKPTDEESDQPADEESDQPGDEESDQPTDEESAQASEEESSQPSDEGSVQPTDEESAQASEEESSQPSDEGSVQPTDEESVQPTDEESDQPADESAQPADEQAVQPVTVVFNVEPEKAQIAVYAVDNNASEDSEATDPIPAQEDGSFALLPGEYTYSAEAEGYKSIEGVPFTVEESDEPLTINIEMEAEETEETEEAEETEAAEEPLPFDQSATVDGVVITVRAEAGAFPNDAELSVKHVYAGRVKQAGEAIDEVRDEDQNVAASYTFDIKVVDPDTNEELQPAEGYSVEVSFALNEAGDANLEANVYHITDESGELTAEALETTAGGETVSAISDGFSLYTVEFTYGDLEYVLRGGGRVALSDILAELGLSGAVEKVTVSDRGLFEAAIVDGEYVVASKKAFDTTEWMKVRIDGITYEITVTDDQQITSWSALQTALAAGGRVTLAQDLTAVEGDITLTVSAGVSVTLDLNGHTLDADGKVDNVFEVKGENAQLTLTGDGAVTGAKEAGVYVNSSGKLTLSGGTITGNGRDNRFRQAGGVHVLQGTFEMSGGTISDNTAEYGGGVRVINGAFTMSGGTISGNTAEYCGGGVDLNNNCMFTMTGGAISGNTANNGGGGVYVGDYATFNLSGGEITDNRITNPYSINGGGVYVNSNARSFNLSGDPVVSGNTAHGTANNIWINKAIAITRPLRDKCDVGVTWKGSADAVFTSGYSDNGNTALPWTYFFSDDTGKKVYWSDGRPKEAKLANADGVTYRKYDTDKARFVTAICDSYENITQSNIPKPWSNGTWYVVNDTVTIDDRVTVNGNVHLILRDGATLTVPAGITVASGSSLTIYGQAGGTGALYAGCQSEGGTLITTCGIYDAGIGGGSGQSAGTITIHGGKVTANGGSTGSTSENKSGAGIGGGSKGAGGTVTIYGGTVTANGGKGSAGIGGGYDANAANGDITIRGGKVTATGGRVGAGIGGGMRGAGGAVTIHGGTVHATGSYYGAGIGGGYDANAANGDITISGGTVTATSVRGAGIGTAYYPEVMPGTITISGGRVTATSERGAGIGGGKIGSNYNVPAGNITLGWTNSADFILASSYDGTVKLTNDFKYTGSGGVVGLPATGENALEAAQVNAIAGKTLTPATLYSVTVLPTEFGTIEADAVKAAAGQTVTLTLTPLTGYAPDTLGYAPAGSATGTPIIPDSNGAYAFTMPAAAVTVKATFVDEWNELQKAMTNTPNTGEQTPLTVSDFDIDKNNIITASATDHALEVKAGHNILLDLDGVTLDRRLTANDETKEPVIQVNQAGMLTIVDHNSQGKIGIIKGGNHSGIRVGPGASGSVGNTRLTLMGGTITGNTTNASNPYGGGVYAQNATVTIKNDEGKYSSNSPTITGNTASTKGGGVYVFGGNLTISGGKISSNEATNDGGGVYVDGNGTFNLSGGTIGGASADDANKAQMAHGSGGGGGVCVYSGTFKMTGGTIAYNQSGSCGGGVYSSKSTVTLNGGVIQYNETKGSGTYGSNGGGVYVTGNDKEVHINGCKIEHNHADKNGNNAAGKGGGVYINQAKVTFGKTGSTGCTVSNNTADDSGGGVYVAGTNSSFTMSAGTITGNEATVTNGGGVCMDGGEFTMTGGSIAGNKATTGNGGGVFVNNGGTFTMKKDANSSSAGISGNDASNKGGGVCVYGTFNMSDGTISGNNAKNGGGVYVGQNGTFNISGAPVISGNRKDATVTASGLEDGADNNVYLTSGTTITVADALSSASVGVTTETKPTKATSVPFTEGLKEKGDIASFTSDNTAYTVLESAMGEAMLVVPLKVTINKSTGGKVTLTHISSQPVNDNSVIIHDDVLTLKVEPDAGWLRARNCLSATYTDANGVAQSIAVDQDDDDKALFYVTMPGEDVVISGSFITEWQDLQNQITATEQNGGTLTLNKDYKANNEAGDTALVVSKTITLDMNGHKIDRNLTDPVSNGNVITVNGSLTVKDSASGGAITGGNNFEQAGGGVIVEEGGVFTLAGGAISGNKAAYDDGGGVAVRGTFNMTGGTISGNTAAYDGGGVMLYKGAFNLSGGKITGNDATGGFGGGVNVFGGKLSVSGKPVVSGNNAASGDAVPNTNVYLSSGKTITVADALTNGASIGVTTEAKPGTAELVTLTSGLKGKGDLSAFSSDDSKYTIGWNAAQTEAVLGLTAAVTATGYSGNYDGKPHGIIVKVTAPTSGATVKYGESQDACDKDKLAFINAGTYTVYYKVTAQGYCPVTGSAKVEIKPIEATVTITGKTGTAPYDGQAHTVTGYTAKASTDLYDVAKDFTFSGTATASQTNAGKAMMGLKASQFTNTNPNFSTVTFKVTDGYQEITRASITITADNQTTRYGDEIASLTHKIGGAYVDGDDLGISLATKATSYSKPGTYPITVAWNSNPNYTATLKTGTYTITARSATIKAKAQTITEGEKIKTGVDQVEVTGLAPNDRLKDIELSVSSEANTTKTIASSEANSTITVSNAKIVDEKGKDVTGNYALKYTSGKLTIRENPQPANPDYTLLGSLSICGSKALRVTWSPVSGADGYDVYLTKADCSYRKGRVVSVTWGTTVKFSGLKKKTAYKAYVRAWRSVDGRKIYIGKASPTVYAITGGWNSKYCNAKLLILNTGKTLSLKVGKTKTLKATVKGVKGSKKVYHKEKAVRWYSSDRNVATVNSNGKIKAVGKGSCVIWAIANNGVRSSVKVTVK